MVEALIEVLSNFMSIANRQIYLDSIAVSLFTNIREKRETAMLSRYTLSSVLGLSTVSFNSFHHPSSEAQTRIAFLLSMQIFKKTKEKSTLAWKVLNEGLIKSDKFDGN